MSMIFESFLIGQKVGIVFFGGLDISVVLYWMKLKGVVLYVYMVNFGQFDEDDYDVILKCVIEYGVVGVCLIDCCVQFVVEGIVVL